MIIYVGDIYSAIDKPRSCMAAVAIARDVCKARPDGYQYMPRFRSGFWDGYIYLTRPNYLSQFPTGLLSLVVAALQAKGYNLELRGQKLPIHKVVDADVLSGITLRDYQVDAANTLLGAGRGVAGMATNSGKTEVMAAIAWALDCTGVIVLVNGRELLHQTAERLAARLNTPVGKLGDGIRDIQSVTVATLQTLVKHPNLPEFANTRCILVDECHHASSDMALDILANMPGQYRFGFSGTPLKYDKLADMKLMAYTGPLVYELTNKHLIDKGYSAKPTIHIISIDNGSEFWEADYQTAYAELIVNNSKRNEAIAKTAKGAKGTVLILVTRIGHGNELAKLIPGSTFIHGSDASERRQEVLAAMASGGGGCYIATPILDEGVDVPGVDFVIIAGGGASHIKLLQRIGRGLRAKCYGANVLTVVDFLDLSNKHLLQHSEARIDVYSAQGFKLRKR